MIDNVPDPIVFHKKTCQQIFEGSRRVVLCIVLLKFCIVIFNLLTQIFKKFLEKRIFVAVVIIKGNAADHRPLAYFLYGNLIE